MKEKQIGVGKYRTDHLAKPYCSFCAVDLKTNEIENAEVEGEHFEVCGRCHHKLITKRPKPWVCECDDDGECERHNEIGAQ